MHKRRAILEALRDQVNAIPYFAAVWIQRRPPSRNSFPSVTIYNESETVEMDSIHPAPRSQLRRMLVSFSAWIPYSADAEKPEADMDNASLQLEQAIRRPVICDDASLIATDMQISTNDQGEIELYELKLTYQVTYRTNEHSPV